MQIEPIVKLYNKDDTMKITSSQLILPNRKHQEKNNLHKTFSTMMVVAQVFGYLPTQGVLGPDFRSLHFTWISARVLYSILTILGAMFVFVVQLHKIFVKGFDLMEANRCFFHFFGLLGGILFLKLAKNWPSFMKYWSGIEHTMSSYGWPAGLRRRINTLLAVFMTLALGEYLLSQLSKLLLAIHCKETTSEAVTYFLSTMSFSHLFSLVNYNAFMGILVQLINLQLVFIWTFNDVFVMIISSAVAQRFSQIADRIQAISAKKVDVETTWKTLREDYTRLCKLCRRVDEEVSYIVLITFASDLFFILVQLFNSLKRMRSDLERIYFYWSFGLLIVRTICLCLYGAKVNDESTRPMLILNSVPSSVYNSEIQRFIQQIGMTEVALTGKNFFSITRGLILSIAGAIVTYELVLIQFNDTLLKSEPEREGPCPIFV